MSVPPSDIVQHPMFVQVMERFADCRTQLAEAVEALKQSREREAHFSQRFEQTNDLLIDTLRGQRINKKREDANEMEAVVSAKLYGGMQQNW